MTYQVVVGIDGSAHSRAALRWALDEARAHSGSVTAVFAWQMPFLSFPGAYSREELDKVGREFILEVVSAEEPTPQVPLLTLVAEGDPAESLVAAAKGADLLVLGSRGRSPWAGLVLGAVSQRCAATASCPVVIVKLPREDGTEEPFVEPEPE